VSTRATRVDALGLNGAEVEFSLDVLCWDGY